MNLQREEFEKCILRNYALYGVDTKNVLRRYEGGYGVYCDYSTQFSWDLWQNSLGYFKADVWLDTYPPEDGTTFYAWHKSLIHPDFNPSGVVEAVFNGEEFVGAVWDPQFDNWNTLAIYIDKWKPIVGPTL